MATMVLRPNGFCDRFSKPCNVRAKLNRAKTAGSGPAGDARAERSIVAYESDALAVQVDMPVALGLESLEDGTRSPLFPPEASEQPSPVRSRSYRYLRPGLRYFL